MPKTSDSSDATRPEALVRFAGQIIDAYIRGNHLAPTDVTRALTSVHATLQQLASGAAGEPSDEGKPAVSIKKSITDTYIVCLEDGKRLTMLKRYLRTHFDMSPEDYRRKWNLPHDYPMVAPAYARLRSAFAKKTGLGHIPTGRATRKT